MAANQTWATAKAAEGQFAFTTLTDAPQVPLVLTLALVVLASWGVLLVTRGRVRRVVALPRRGRGARRRWWRPSPGAGRLADSFEQDFADQGATALVDFGAWWWVAVVAAGAQRRSPRCSRPRRSVAGRRWAPATTHLAPVPTGRRRPHRTEEQTSLDLWKSIDEGHDPTA